MKKLGIFLMLLMVMQVFAFPASAADPLTYLVQFGDYDNMDINWTAVHTFVDSGIVKGFPESQLMPETPITREQLATLISRAKTPAASMFTDQSQESFSDVNSSLWSYESIKLAGSYFTDILSSKDKFEPGKDVTREEFYAVLARANGYDSQSAKSDSSSVSIPDFSEVSSKYKNILTFAFEKKLIETDEDGKLTPKGAMKRSEAIGLIYRKFYFDQPAFEVNGTQVSMGEFMFQRTQRKVLVINQDTRSGKDFNVQDLINDSAKYAKDYITRRIITQQKAAEMGITLTAKDKDDIDQVIPTEIKNMESEAEFEKFLKYNCYTREIIVTNLTRDMLYDKLNASVVKDIKATDRDILNYYNENANIYKTRELSRVTQIAIKTVDQGNKELSAPLLEAAKNKAEEALTKAKNGEDFVKLVKEYSEDGYSSNIDGRLIFSKGDVEKPFEDAVSNLEIGKISDLIKTSRSYCIVKLEERVPEKIRTLEDEKENIQTVLTPRLKDKFFEDTCKKWEGEAKIELIGIKI